MERSQAFKGRYHVLHGALSPLNGITPALLKITELLRRLEDGTVREVLIATNFTVEGEATALYLSRLIKPLSIKVTRRPRFNGLSRGVLSCSLYYRN